MRKIHSFRHLRDAIDVFMQIMIKAKLTKRAEYQREWLKRNRENYFDLDFGQSGKLDKKFNTLVVRSHSLK